MSLWDQSDVRNGGNKGPGYGRNQVQIKCERLHFHKFYTSENQKGGVNTAHYDELIAFSNDLLR